MACNPLIVDPGANYDRADLWARASAELITSAKFGFKPSECSVPASVEVGEVFDIVIKYQYCGVVINNQEQLLDMHFPDYDGIFLYHYGTFGNYIRYWVWRFTQMAFRLDYASPGHSGFKSPRYHGRSGLNPGDTFTYQFHGTVRDLIGYTPTEPISIDLTGTLKGWNSGLYEPSDMWPYDWNPYREFLNLESGWITDQITAQIQITIPTPPPLPNLAFNTNLCSISKSQVAPDEPFIIRTTVVNQNHGEGSYEIGCYCEGNYLPLGAGAVAENDTDPITHEFSVTANQLAQGEITESQWLSLLLVVSNEATQTNSWSPPSIAVIVTEPPAPANLSGTVTDKLTGAFIAGATVRIGTVSKTTNASGFYSFPELEVGLVTVRVSAGGYAPEGITKSIVVGSNTLDVALSPGSASAPIPWQPVVAIAAVAIGAITIAQSKQRRSHA